MTKFKAKACKIIIYQRFSQSSNTNFVDTAQSIILPLKNPLKCGKIKTGMALR